MVWEFLFKSFVAYLAVVHQSSAAYSPDQTQVQACLPSMQNYLTCVKQEVRYHSKIVGTEITDDFKHKVDECFRKVGCPRVPTKEPTIESHMKGADVEIWKTFRSWIEALPTPKRQCIIRKLGDSYRKTFVDCINKVVPGIVARDLEDKVTLPPDVLKVLNERAYWRTMVSDSFHDCERHEDAAACIIELRRTEFTQSCAIRNHCAVIDDDAGFNDCTNLCSTLDEKCKDIIKNMRDDVCNCSLGKRRLLLTVGQRHVLTNASSQFLSRAVQVAKIILNDEEKNDPLYSQLQSCGITTPVLKSKAVISGIVARYIILYIDGYTPRDIVYCHRCGANHL